MLILIIFIKAEIIISLTKPKTPTPAWREVKTYNIINARFASIIAKPRRTCYQKRDDRFDKGSWCVRIQGLTREAFSQDANAA